MTRVAFTIIYNALHHLKHNNFAERMADMFDAWVIVEGAANNNGSTSWCNRHPGEDNSTDGTIEYLNELEKRFPNIQVFRGLKKWKSKDDMCNHALNMLSKIIGEEKVFLWEVDADEQWSIDGLEKNEDALRYSGKTTGAVRWNHFVSHDLICVGDWGGNLNTRVWIWENPQLQRFITHEPPQLEHSTEPPVELPVKCNHYSYLFEKDVFFKSQWYGGHGRIYQPWVKLQLEGERAKLHFPLHISFLFGKDNWVGRSNSHIIKFPKDENKEQAQVSQQAARV